MTFVFNLTSPTLRKIVEHSATHPCHEAYSKDTAAPSLFIVKDDGAYLMSASVEHCVDEKRTRESGGRTISEVEYAEGCRPEDGHIGGDDFAENVPVEWFSNAIAAGHTIGILKLGDNIEFTSK